MHSLRRILVAVKDLNDKSCPAIVKAGELARASGAALELFHALDMTLYVDAYLGKSLAKVKRDLHAQALQRLEAIAEGLRRRRVKVNVAAEWDFPAYEAVVRRANRINADLIVTENHRARHRLPGVLRLTDWELLRLSSVPVLLVKTARSYRRPVVLAAVDPSHAFAKPGKLDDEILRVGSAITHALRGTLHAVHAYMPFSTTLVNRDVAAAYAADRMAAQAARARSTFEQTLKSTKIPRTRQHLTSQYAADAIVGAARRTHSAIVVMGAISRSGLKRFFIGNTAERVLDQLGCDILIVKSANFRSQVPRGRRGPRLAALPPGFISP